MSITSLAHVSGLPVNDKPFLLAFAKAMDRLGYSSEHADWLLATISFESGFDPSIQNQYTRATGLIQWMPMYAPMDVDELKQLSRVEQMPYVEAHFRPYKNIDPRDIPFAVFYPKAIGKADSDVIFTEGQKGYAQNEGLDWGGKGYITVADYRRGVLKRYQSSIGKERVPVPSGSDVRPTSPTASVSGDDGAEFWAGTLGLLLAGVLLAKRRKK